MWGRGRWTPTIESGSARGFSLLKGFFLTTVAKCLLTGEMWSISAQFGTCRWLLNWCHTNKERLIDCTWWAKSAFYSYLLTLSLHHLIGRLIFSSHIWFRLVPLSFRIVHVCYRHSASSLSCWRTRYRISHSFCCLTAGNRKEMYVELNYRDFITWPLSFSKIWLAISGGISFLDPKTKARNVSVCCRTKTVDQKTICHIWAGLTDSQQITSTSNHQLTC